MKKGYKSECESSQFTRISKISHKRWIIRYDESIKESDESNESSDSMIEFNGLIISFIPNYDNIVVALIREKYSRDAETALSRQRDKKVDEWEEYYNYCEHCKEEARKIMSEYSKLISDNHE